MCTDGVITNKRNTNNHHQLPAQSCGDSQRWPTRRFRWCTAGFGNSHGDCASQIKGKTNKELCSSWLLLVGVPQWNSLVYHTHTSQHGENCHWNYVTTSNGMVWRKSSVMKNWKLSKPQLLPGICGVFAGDFLFGWCHRFFLVSVGFAGITEKCGWVCGVAGALSLLSMSGHSLEKQHWVPTENSRTTTLKLLSLAK